MNKCETCKNEQKCLILWRLRTRMKVVDAGLVPDCVRKWHIAADDCTLYEEKEAPNDN